jgi:DNA-binding NarL/FixJ family response regulator
MIDILLADDQPQVRSAVRLLLEQQPDLHVLGETMDAQGVLDWVSATSPDLVLLDWELPGLQGGDALATLRALHPHLKMIALSGLPEARDAALAAGVDAFVSKGDPPEQLLAAVRSCWLQPYTLRRTGP